MFTFSASLPNSLRRTARAAGLLSVGALSTLGVLSLTHVGPAYATSPGGSLATLVARLNADDAKIASLQSQQAAAPSTATTIYGPFTVTGNDVYLTGYNLHIQSGAGTTYGAINGKGNLIIGYDEGRGGGADNRTGSHNLILGTRNNFSGYGGLVAGAQNGITGGYTTITGGYGNRAVGTYSSVSGGQGSTATAAYDLEPEAPAVTSLQTQVTALGSTQAAQGKITSLFSLSTDATRTDGLLNSELNLTGVNLHVVNGLGSTQTQNGLGNLTIGYNGTGNDHGAGDVRTGSHNLILGDRNSYSSIGGLVAGLDNTISGAYATVTGGNSNTANGFLASVTAGQNNTASGSIASISGGSSGTASGSIASVSGGFGNTASGDYASVSGGASLTVTGGYNAGTWDGAGPTWAATTFSGH